VPPLAGPSTAIQYLPPADTLAAGISTAFHWPATGLFRVTWDNKSAGLSSRELA